MQNFITRHELLRDMVRQNMLEHGESPERAEALVDLICEGIPLDET